MTELVIHTFDLPCNLTHSDHESSFLSLRQCVYGSLSSARLQAPSKALSYTAFSPKMPGQIWSLTSFPG